MKKSGSSQFDKRQYEDERKTHYNEHKEYVKQGIRAVLTMYIMRERDPEHNDLDVLVNDRISEWRTMERSDKFWFFKKFMLINFFAVGMMGASGYLNDFESILLYVIFLIIFAQARQVIKSIFIKGNVGTKYQYQKTGVKRAIRDVWFETIISVQMSYFLSTGICIFFWILANSVAFAPAQYAMSKFVDIGQMFDVEVTSTDPVMLLNVYFVTNLIYIWSDFFYWKIVHSKDIPLLPFEHDEINKIEVDENDISLTNEDEILNGVAQEERIEEEVSLEMDDEISYKTEVKDNLKKRSRVKQYLSEVNKGTE